MLTFGLHWFPPRLPPARMTASRRLVHTESIPMRWGDMDALGHVNNAVYFRFMEQARVGFFDACGLGRGELAEVTNVVVNASCNFRRPLVYPGTVAVRMALSEPGKTSVMSTYDLVFAGESYADGAAKIVFVDRTTLRPCPIPPALRRLCEG